MGEGYSSREEVGNKLHRCRSIKVSAGIINSTPTQTPLSVPIQSPQPQQNPNIGRVVTQYRLVASSNDQHKYHLTTIASRLHTKCHQNLGPHRSSLLCSHLMVDLTNRTLFRSCGRREWVAKCLGQITDTNRSEVQAELKQVISDAFAARTLWTTDWPAMQLQRFSNHTLFIHWPSF